tara:strand:- start:430 stop:1392 length:963 start_codon:yes stop_codon:yes gene_type:complete
MKNKFIIIVCGDPKSTFIEILLKVLNNKKLKKTNLPILLICSKKIILSEMKKFKKKLDLKLIKKNLKNLEKNKIYLHDIPIKRNNLTLKEKNNYIRKAFLVGMDILQKNLGSILINGPLSKKDFFKGDYPGVTEFLAEKTKSKNVAMLIYNPYLSVCPITTHMPINKVSRNIKKKIIISKLTQLDFFYKKYLGYKPKIGVTGLNPHCETFEGTNVEKKEIIPALKILKKRNIKVKGPFSADTVFIKSNRIKFDVIVGMYHDQVLAPMKTIFNFKAINITIGLPFIRITPDHGPNFEMYGMNKSKIDSIVEAFKFIKHHVK